MFRPFTISCAVLAGLSGLFLYSKKHQTTVLDQEISGIVTSTQHIRQQTAMLETQWALLNQPDRLSHLTERFDRGLQPMVPAQFVRMADLGRHLPAAGVAHPAVVHEAPVTMASAEAGEPPVTMAPGAAPLPVVHEAPVRREVAPARHEVLPAPRPVAVADVERKPRHELRAPEPRHELRAPEPRRAEMVAMAQPVAVPVHHEVARHRAENDDALMAAVEPKAVTKRAAAPSRTLVADATPVVHRHAAAAVVASDESRPVAHVAAAPRSGGLTRLASTQHPVTVAAWHPSAAPRYVEARATYSNGSLLGRASMGGGLPPPIPVSN